MRDEQAADDPSAGKMLFRVAAAVLVLIAGAALLTGLLSAIGDWRGALRWIVGGAMGIGIFSFGYGYFRYLGNPPPPDPEPLRVDPELQLAYVCEMCGLELAVVAVAKERAPKHCGEAMILIQHEV